MLVEILPIPRELSLQQIYARLPLDKAGTVLLDSGAEPVPGSAHHRLARYSILAQEPFGVLEADERGVYWHYGLHTFYMESHPLEALQRFLKRYALSPLPQARTPLMAGAVGFLQYGLKAWLEPCPNRLPAPHRLPLYWFGFYDAVSTIDLDRRLVVITSTGLPEVGSAASRRAHERMERLLWQWEQTLYSSRKPSPSVFACGEVEAIWGRDEYRRAHRRIQEYIAAGDVYQVNLAQAFQAPFEGSPTALFLRARQVGAAPFAALLQAEDFTVISLSPERFLHLCPRTRRLHTRPIKGTRPRSADPLRDQQYARELLASPKDRAEHIMIVDLERNDLGRVAEVGSVKVAELMTLEGFAQVYHLTSTVEARLRADTGVSALLRATFPGGSITGAPKVRAMQIIEEVEAVAREVYTGSIGYLGFDGGIDLNIAIRTATVRDQRLTFYAGGGIVADSDAEQEYEETLAKAKGWFKAIGALQERFRVGKVDLVQRAGLS